MPKEIVVAHMHFAPLASNGITIFSFSTFITGLALMVIVWTITDVRYHFRVKTAPLPLYKVSFWGVTFIGALTLLTDLWQANHWLVPVGNIISPALWQAVLAGIFFFFLALWVFWGIVSPPVFKTSTAKRCVSSLREVIMKGNSTQFPIIADEVSRWIPGLIKYAPSKKQNVYGKNKPQNSAQSNYAEEALFLISDRRFCKSIASYSPGTAYELFKEIHRQNRYDIEITKFTRNFIAEAISNKNSFLYHEPNRFELKVGDDESLIQVVFSNYSFIEKMPSLFLYFEESGRNWDHEQFKAYCDVSIELIKSYANAGFPKNYFTVAAAIELIQQGTVDLYEINDLPSYKQHIAVRNLKVTMDFIDEALFVLNNENYLNNINIHISEKFIKDKSTIIDWLAGLAYEVIKNASKINPSSEQGKQVQYLMVWRHLFFSTSMRSSKIFLFKLRRLIVKDINAMGHSPDIQKAHLIRLYLNALGFELRFYREQKAIHQILLKWTKSCFVKLYEAKQEIAKEMLPTSIIFNEKSNTLSRVHPGDVMGTGRREVLYLDVPDKPNPLVTLFKSRFNATK